MTVGGIGCRADQMKGRKEQGSRKHKRDRKRGRGWVRGERAGAVSSIYRTGE